MERIRSKLRKGNSELLMFAITLIPIMTLLMFTASLLQLSRAYAELNKAVKTSGRAVSICTSKEDADTQALRVAQSCITLPYMSDIQTKVEIVDHGNFEANFDWGMSQVAKVTVSGKVDTIAPITSGKRYERSTLVTIEGGGSYLGMWFLTSYCPCSACNGKWTGSPTASGRWYTPYHTIAMARATIDAYNFQWGDKFLIRGHIYTLEDGGDSFMARFNGGKCIDIFVANHGETYSDQFNGMAEVIYLGHES